MQKNEHCVGFHFVNIPLFYGDTNFSRKPPLLQLHFQLLFDYKHSWKLQKQLQIIFLQLGNVFLNYKPAKSINIGQECHYSRKCLRHANTILIATTYHSSYKMFYQSSWGMLSTTLASWMNFICWLGMMSADICNFNYIRCVQVGMFVQ